MARKFRCPKCGKRLVVSQAPGQTTVCKYCSQTVTVPETATEVRAPGAPSARAAPEGGSSVAEEESQEETGMDTVMGWLALYLPSWGTSVVLHLAVILIAALYTWHNIPAQASYDYDSQIVSQQQRKTIKRQKRLRHDTTSRGRLKPQPSSFVRQFTQNPYPDVADNQLEELEVIGVGGGGKELGGFEGLGTGRGGDGFFGAGGDEANKIVYVVDRSGSMTDSIDYVKFELKRSIGELGEEKEFHVIFYSSGPPVEMTTRRLVRATERNKQLAFEFIDRIIPQGETDPSMALERAFAVKPELIYLLTDGEFDRAIVELVKRANVEGLVTIHTIGFLYRTGEEVLQQIASENNGEYKFVSEADLATLVR